MNYTAADIRVPTDTELAERFDWLQADVLARKYRHVTPGFITRLLEACRLSGFDQALAVRRYLEGDQTITPTPELIACHSTLADQRS